MEDFYQLLQHSVGVEREILVIPLVGRVASIYLLLLVRLELRIRSIVFAHRSHGTVVGLIVLHQPDIRILRLVEYCLEAQWYGTTVRVVGEGIIRSGIGIKLTRRATTTRHIPGRTAFPFAHQFRFLRLLSRQLFQFIVILFHIGKDAVCLGFTPEEHPEETYPFGATQGRCLHVVGTLNDGDFQLLHLSVTTAIFIR